MPCKMVFKPCLVKFLVLPIWHIDVIAFFEMTLQVVQQAIKRVGYIKWRFALLQDAEIRLKILNDVLAVA